MCFRCRSCLMKMGGKVEAEGELLWEERKWSGGALTLYDLDKTVLTLLRPRKKGLGTGPSS